MEYFEKMYPRPPHTSSNYKKQVFKQYNFLLHHRLPFQSTIHQHHAFPKVCKRPRPSRTTDHFIG